MNLRDPYDPFWTVLLVVVSIPALLGGLTVLRRATQVDGRQKLTILVAGNFGCAIAPIVFFAVAMKGSYPDLDPIPPAPYLLACFGIALFSGATSGALLAYGKRSARNILIAGSLSGSGFSCIMFVGMSGLVSPYSLSYDLTAVLAVMVLGSALSGFCYWENSGPLRKYTTVYATGLGTLAIVVLAIGSIRSVLGFGDWMNTLEVDNNLTDAPIVVIAAAEGVVILVLGFLGSLVDNRSAARDQREADRLQQMANATFEAIVIHRAGIILDGNANLSSLVEARKDALAKRRLDEFLRFDEETDRNDTAGPARSEGKVTTFTGERIPVETLSREITYRGQPATITALRDIRERQASEEQIRFLAHHDPLTRLPNRTFLAKTLDRMVREARDTGSQMAVHCLDLDGFKPVNDRYGHAAGDDLLQLVADRITECLSDTDFAARVGGDEFVVLQSGIEDAKEAYELAGRLVERLSSDFLLLSGNVTIGTSLGISMYPQDGVMAEDLLRSADAALYKAKGEGRGRFERSGNAVATVSGGRVDLHEEMRRAFSENQFFLSYQPIFDLDRNIVCFEALLRWTHPSFGAISPAVFIPVSEQSEMIVELGEWVLREACRTAAEWPQPCRIAVNLSPVQAIRSETPDLVASILRETGIPADRLELELTEGVIVSDYSAAIEVLGKLHDLGVRLVLDDFGTGYSNLKNLQIFPFDRVKIDKHFLRASPLEAKSCSIISSMITLARDLQVDVTIEGVETQDQLQFLQAGDPAEVQGFLLGKPMSKREVQDLLVKSLPCDKDIQGSERSEGRARLRRAAIGDPVLFREIKA